MTTQALTSTYHTTTAGTKLHYIQTGTSSGPLLICLHGLGGSTHTFNPLLPSLPSTHNIVLLDFPGFGKSIFTKTATKSTITSHVIDLGELVTALQGAANASQTRNVILIGHSLGAIVALHYAAQHPDKIRGLVLLGAGRAAGHIPVARQRMCDLADAVRTKGIAYAADLAAKSNFYEDTSDRVADPAAREAVRKAVLASDPEAYAQTCEAIVSLDHKDPRYNDIVAPAVFIAGDRDMISPIERSQDLSRLLGGTSWVDIVKSGHQPILEDLQGVKQAIGKLLSSIAMCSAARDMKEP